MKILSIDVGIKNLAFCMLDLSGNKYTIDSWDVINLCNDHPLCNSCKAKSVFNKDNVHFCKRCAKKSGYIIPSDDISNITKKNVKVSVLREFIEKYNIETITNNMKKSQFIINL